MKWVITYYVNNKFGQMAERQKVLPAKMPANEVRLIMDRMISGAQAKGVSIHPTYDMTLDRVAA